MFNKVYVMDQIFFLFMLLDIVDEVSGMKQLPEIATNLRQNFCRS